MVYVTESEEAKRNGFLLPQNFKQSYPQVEPRSDFFLGARKKSFFWELKPNVNCEPPPRPKKRSEGL